MIVSNLTGGLGNQMFQYAFGRHLALRNNTELKLHFTNALFNTQYEYGLDVFKIKAQLADEKNLKKLKVFENRIINRILYLFDERFEIQFNKKIITDRPPYTFNPLILQFRGSAYFQGYWSDERYFKTIEEIIRKDFTFKNQLDKKNKKVANLIKKTNSVSVHVRRGDYITNKINVAKFKVLEVDYYRSSVKKIQNKVTDPVFFIFSNDIPWCKENLRINHPAYFINHNRNKNSYRDMQLMSLCKHNIIANSTFSWWGAWLNKNIDKIVIRPS